MPTTKRSRSRSPRKSSTRSQQRKRELKGQKGPIGALVAAVTGSR